MATTGVYPFMAQHLSRGSTFGMPLAEGNVLEVRNRSVTSRLRTQLEGLLR